MLMINGGSSGMAAVRDGKSIAPNLMTLQPKTEHPHGLSDYDFDVLFTGAYTAYLLRFFRRLSFIATKGIICVSI